MAERLNIAIVGAGIGGLTAAACSRRVGHDVTIYEQAHAFTRLGAGLQQAPNAVRVLFALGLEPKLLAACSDAHKWALVVREPLSHWTEGHIALLGDACHPMTPYMARGASSSIDDAAALARCLEGVGRDGIATALQRYESTRLERTATIQRTSAQNTWRKNATNPDWVYGYDAWTTPLA